MAALASSRNAQPIEQQNCHDPPRPRCNRSNGLLPSRYSCVRIQWALTSGFLPRVHRCPTDRLPTGSAHANFKRLQAECNNDQQCYKQTSGTQQENENIRRITKTIRTWYPRPPPRKARNKDKIREVSLGRAARVERTNLATGSFTPVWCAQHTRTLGTIYSWTGTAADSPSLARRTYKNFGQLCVVCTMYHALLHRTTQYSDKLKGNNIHIGQLSAVCIRYTTRCTALRHLSLGVSTARLAARS